MSSFVLLAESDATSGHAHKAVFGATTEPQHVAWY
jgi:hypothetical protein